MKGLAGVLVALLLTATADAHHTDTPRSKFNASAGIAEVAWPDNPCAPNITVRWDQEAVQWLADNFRSGNTFGCEVYINPNLSPVRFCEVLAHEYGHTAGQHHTDRGLMQESVGTWSPCRKLHPPFHRKAGMRQAKRYADRAFPVETFRCRRRSGRTWHRVTCVGQLHYVVMSYNRGGVSFTEHRFPQQR